MENEEEIFVPMLNCFELIYQGELYAWGKGDYSKEAASQNTVSLMESKAYFEKMLLRFIFLIWEFFQGLYPKRLMPEGNNAIHVKFIKVGTKS